MGVHVLVCACVIMGVCICVFALPQVCLQYIYICVADACVLFVSGDATLCTERL